MESQLILLFTAILTGVAIENAVFTRALGLSKTFIFLDGTKTGLIYGALTIWILSISSVFVGIINQTALQSHGFWIAIPLYLLSVCAVYAATYLVMQKKLPRLFAKTERVMPLIAFNTALFGAFFIVMGRHLSISATIGYSFGTGVGYTIALLVIHFARKRLAVSPVPRSFRGLPILFLYIGLISLALYGLIGQGLPT